MLLVEWTTQHPISREYTHPPTLTPYPVVGRGKFVAGKIHQMRAGQGYPAAHRSWFEEDRLEPDKGAIKMMTHSAAHHPKRHGPLPWQRGPPERDHIHRPRFTTVVGQYSLSSLEPIHARHKNWVLLRDAPLLLSIFSRWQTLSLPRIVEDFRSTLVFCPPQLPKNNLTTERNDLSFRCYLSLYMYLLCKKPGKPFSP